MPLKLISIRPSHKSTKKYDAVFDNDGRRKIVSFGAHGYSDFTKHKDEERKQHYLNRHKANESWSNPTTPGALSRWILWNKPSFRASVADFKSRFHL
jgi:hypothetical protein